MSVTKKRVFNWNQHAAWDRVFHHLLADKINETVINEARRVNPCSIADDNFAWLDSLVATVTRQRSEHIPALLAKRLSGYYEFIIAFHATRSDSAADFLNNGIRLSDIKTLNRRAIDEFGDSDALRAEMVRLRQCEEHDHGKIFFFLTKDGCLSGACSHYLQRGSEHYAALAHSVGQCAKLEARGKPLIIECLIPTSALESESVFWRGRGYSMLEDYFTRLLRPSEKRRVESSCAIVTQPLLAENILRVHEFTEIKRPYQERNLNTGAADARTETTFRPFKIWLGRAQL